MRAAKPRVRVFLISAVMVVAVFVGALAGGSYFAEAGGPAKGSVSESVECKKTADCVVVPDDCCGCTQGGKQRAFAKGKAAAYEKARKKRCEGTICAEMMSQDPSCSLKATCSKGLCALTAAE